jgi:hypothetical protein
MFQSSFGYYISYLEEVVNKGKFIPVQVVEALMVAGG